MSKQVDNRIVSMEFDNRQFEKNVSTSLGTIDKLKKSLNFGESAKSLQDVTKAASKCDLSGVGRGVETLQAKFSALQVVAVTAIANIANQAVNYGKRIASALTIEPIKMGFQEYETQINAVQTILANTQSKGTTLKNVNAALDELNTYADKTIYNFTEMTRNIGTFTAAGVDLDTSVSAIKGIANLAAVSGSTSQQASTAMYQLSQALAAGTVKLMDWNSVVNAGMGGQVFQDALKETARVHGINIDEMIKKEGSFRETLQNGWLTSSILTETLAKFTGDLNAEQLKSIGYTDDQIEEILKLGQTANDAATKVKTFTQLVDTLKEAAQSGWTQTWELLVGDFEQAKELWTNVSDVIGKAINDSANARNSMLQGWSDGGGREKLIQSLGNAFNGLVSVITPIREAFREIFPRTTSKQLLAITDGILKLTEKFKIGDTTASNLKTTFKGVFALFDIGVKAVTALFKGFSKFVGYILPVGDGLLGITAGIGEFVIKLNEALESSDAFNKVIDGLGKFLKPIGEGIKTLGSAIKDSLGGAFDNMSERFGPLSALGEGLKATFVGLSKVMEHVIPVFSAIAKKIGDAIGVIRDAISSAVNNADYNSFFDLLNGGIFAGIGVGIFRFIKNIGDATKDAGSFLENINNILEGVGDALNAFTGSIKANTLKTIATAIAILAGSLLVLALIPSDRLNTSLAAITALFTELMIAMSAFGKITDGNKFKGVSKVAAVMVTLSSSLLILAVAMKLMSTMSWSEMSVGLISMTAGLGMLVGAINLLPEKNVNKAAKALTKMAGAMIVLGVALKIMGSMSWSELGVGLTAMAAGLGAMVAALNLLPKDAKGRTAGMIGMATAMVILGSALKIMGSMSWLEIGRGLTAMAGGLAAIVLAMRLLPKDVMSKATGMLIMAGAMTVLGKALSSMGGMSWEEIGRGLTVLGGSLLILAAAMKLMSGGLTGAAAMIIMAGALAIFTPVLKTLGGMSWEEIGRGLTALAGAFTVIGVAGYALAPVIPAILGLAGAAALLGVSCLAVGVGVMAFATGLATLAAAGAGSAVAITAIVSSLIGLIPYLLEQVGLGIVALCEVIAGSADAICGAITTIITAAVQALVTCVPTIVDGVFVLIDSLLQALITYTPTIVSKLAELIVILFDGLSAYTSAIVGSLVNFLGSILDSVASNASALIGPVVNLFVQIFQGVADAIGPIVQIIVDAISVLVEAIAPVIEQFGNLVESVGTAIEDIFNGIADVVRSVGDTIKSVLDGISGVIESIGDAALNAGTGFENLANGVKTITELKLGDMAASLTAVATGVGAIAKHSSGLAKAGTGMKNIASGTKLTQKAFNDIASGIDKVIKKILEIGPKAKTATSTLETAFKKSASLLTSMRTSITGDTTKITSSITSMCRSCVSALSGLVSQFRSAGRNAVIGFANGISSNTYLAAAKARAMANAASNAAKRALDEHSPSKVFYGIGNFAGVAFVNALSTFVSKAGKVGTDLADSSVAGMQTVVSKVADALNGNMDAQPTIRPVLDLSNIRSGANAIGSMLNGGSLSYSTRLAGAISASPSRIQNGSNNDVISALKDLGNRISKSTGNVYNVNGVTYDDGSNIANAIESIIREARVERRV